MNKPIHINNFQKGIAISPLFGFQEIRGLNITDKPGFIYSNRALVDDDNNTAVDDFMLGMVKTSEGEVWGYSREGGNHVFKRTSGGVWSELTAHTDTGINGITFWKGYVAIIQGGSIDWYDIADDTCESGWSASVITSNATHPTIHAQDDALYLGAGNVIDKIVEDTDFLPETGATYTITKAAFTLPEDYTITCFEELGSKLLIGTKKAGDDLSAKIFVWDRAKTTLDGIIKIEDEGVWEMITINNLTYVRAGLKGRWYVTDGTNVRLLGEIPTTLLDLTSVNLAYHGNSFNIGDLIYFPVGYGSALSHLGLYSINIHTGVVNYEHIISANETGENEGVLIGGCMPVGGATTNFVVAWWDLNAPAYGVDNLSATKYTSDRTFLISEWYQLGFDGEENSLERPVLKLAQPLASGDSVKVYYREALNGSWTEHYSEDTVDFQEGAMDAINDIQNIQFKVVLNKDAMLEAIILV